MTRAKNPPPTASRILALVEDFYAEAQMLCGSEGMFQNLFHHHALRHFSARAIRREVGVTNGYVDFVIEDGAATYAFELKAGANGHRNSLEKMLEEFSVGGKGLDHDLNKLKQLRAISPGAQGFLLCLDLTALRLAFTPRDVSRFGSMATASGCSLIYLAQGNPRMQVRSPQGATMRSVSIPDSNPGGGDIGALLDDPAFWVGYFADVRDLDAPECHHVGVFHHKLREAGANCRQLSSEVFFNCNRKGTRAYHIVDTAVFTPACQGQFQLYGNRGKTVENDAAKIAALVGLIEFKGGTSFACQSRSRRIEGIAADLAKLRNEVSPRIVRAAGSLSFGSGWTAPRLVVVVTDDDPQLASELASLRAAYRGQVDLHWAGETIRRP